MLFMVHNTTTCSNGWNTYYENGRSVHTVQRLRDIYGQNNRSFGTNITRIVERVSVGEKSSHSYRLDENINSCKYCWKT